ncbi:hypothetical protein DFH06DRAFT_1378227 [Mycena polygramma]|nr:hypothetical protein DFH06DRAFT_1378227 [Mycena polygramma]
MVVSRVPPSSNSPCVKLLLPPIPAVAHPIHRRSCATAAPPLLLAIRRHPSGTLFKSVKIQLTKSFNVLKLVLKSRRPRNPPQRRQDSSPKSSQVRQAPSTYKLKPAMDEMLLRPSCHRFFRHLTSTLPAVDSRPRPRVVDLAVVPLLVLILLKLWLSRPQWETVQAASSFKTSRLQNLRTPQESRGRKISRHVKTSRVQNIKMLPPQDVPRRETSSQNFRTPQGKTSVGCCAQVPRPQDAARPRDSRRRRKPTLPRMPQAFQDLKNRLKTTGPPGCFKHFKTSSSRLEPPQASGR